uniref:Uncharacterized protein n=1 Tax=Ditylenchus dipsaci TaxID=166011 RepID=A0A915DIG0_9BILA
MWSIPSDSSIRTFQSISSHLLRKEPKLQVSYLNLVRKEFQRRVSSVETKRASTKLRNASLKDLKNIICWQLHTNGEFSLVWPAFWEVLQSIC